MKLRSRLKGGCGQDCPPSRSPDVNLVLMKRILVIGATGNVGREVVSQLIGTNVRVRAMARNPDSASLPAQIESVRGDLTIPATLDPSLDDVDVVFLVWTAPATAVAPALERIAKHVPRVVFLSAPHRT